VFFNVKGGGRGYEVAIEPERDLNKHAEVSDVKRCLSFKAGLNLIAVIITKMKCTFELSDYCSALQSLIRHNKTMDKAWDVAVSRVEGTKETDVANTLSKCLVTEQYRVHCKMLAINTAMCVSFVCRVWHRVSYVHSLLQTAMAHVPPASIIKTPQFCPQNISGVQKHKDYFPKGINRLGCVREGKCFVWEIRIEVSEEEMERE
jgi:hypothetical protein